MRLALPTNRNLRGYSTEHFLHTHRHRRRLRVSGRVCLVPIVNGYEQDELSKWLDVLEQQTPAQVAGRGSEYRYVASCVF